MTLDDIARLIAGAEAAGLAELTVAADGATLRLDFAAAPARGKPAAAAPPAAPPPPRAVRARAIGRFRAAHPAAAAPAAAEGATVAAGTVVGFLAVGTVLTAVVAEEAGRLGRRLVAEDAVVGWGDAVFLYD